MSRPSVRGVAAEVEKCFVQHRQSLAEKVILQRVGMDYSAFLNHQRTLAPELALEIWSAYQSVELGVELLIAGVDSTGAHLYQIIDPGVAECFDSIGYAAIGSGLPHAEGFLTEANYSPQISLIRGVWLAYVAKKRSERAPGVGSRYTDVMIIWANGAHFISTDSLERAFGIYSSQLTGVSQSVEQAIDEVGQEINNISPNSESSEGDKANAG